MHPIVPLLQLLNVLGKIEGRKRLQKMVHILKELGAKFPERFQYSFYGMYSLQLRSEIDLLREEGLVKEYQVGSSVSVEKTRELAELLEQFELADPPEWAKTAHYLNNLTPGVLEGISTILYLRHTEPDEKAVEEQLLTLKPHVENYVEECFREAAKLEFAA